jgi:hypothetical protein
VNEAPFEADAAVTRRMSFAENRWGWWYLGCLG